MSFSVFYDETDLFSSLSLSSSMSFILSSVRLFYLLFFGDITKPASENLRGFETLLFVSSFSNMEVYPNFYDNILNY